MTWAMRLGALTIGVTGLILTVPSSARAHEGPPFPLLVDQRIGRYVLSVWTDPDIGIGTFYVVFEPSAPDLPAGEPRTVRVAVAPESGRLPERIYDARAQPVRRGAQYLAEVEFDRGEFWAVRVIVEGADGRGELEARVEATPDGTIGPIGMVVYLVPFLLVGGLWVRVSVLRRRARREPAG